MIVKIKSDQLPSKLIEVVKLCLRTLFRLYAISLGMNLIVLLPLSFVRISTPDNVVIQGISIFVAVTYVLIAPFAQIYFAFKILAKKTRFEKIVCGIFIALITSLLTSLRKDLNFFLIAMFVMFIYEGLVFCFMWNQSRKTVPKKEKDSSLR